MIFDKAPFPPIAFKSANYVYILRNAQVTIQQSTK